MSRTPQRRSIEDEVAENRERIRTLEALPPPAFLFPAQVFFAEIAGIFGSGVENNPAIPDTTTAELNLTAVIGESPPPFEVIDDGSGNLNGVSVDAGFYIAAIYLFFYTDPTGATLNFTDRGAGPWGIVAFNGGGPDSSGQFPINPTQTVDTVANLIYATCMFQSTGPSVLGVDLINNSGGTLDLMDISTVGQRLSSLTIYRLTATE